MSNLIRTFKIEIGKVYNGNVECKNPKVELAGKQHIAVNCIDHDKCLYSVQLGPNDTEPCLKFIVTCEECDTCGPKIIDKCFCDSIDDCKDCEICNEDGFCETTCPDGICDDGVCVECNEEHPCECNKICQNGSCVCPVGTQPNENGCCDECVIPASDADLFPPSGCDVCEVCIDKGGYTVCEQKDCNCDITGKCGTPGECVVCTNSGHCPENEVCNSHCECDCAPGYTRIDGVCIPTECPNGDEDCPICEICSGTVCVPNQCPPGKVPAVINGECQCVQECNCEQPDCDSLFNYCGDSAIPGKCACLPCEGNCDDGCEAPCICDEDLNKCKYNPCFGPCETGLDCGPTCGCGEDGQCIPCESLDCSTTECDQTLGCICSNTGECKKDTSCNDAPCSVASDCGLGCTCDQGICVSCANFSCETSECDERDGCACNGNDCGGDEEQECDETVTLEKDDEECEIVGTLVKDNCCQCPALTLDVILSNSKNVGVKKEFTFKVEVRKGSFDGISPTANPLVDEDHPEIAENEAPLSGTIRLSYEITYDVFDAGSGAYVGVSTSSPVSTNATYLGSVSQVTFSGVQFEKIGSESVSGGQKKVVKSIKITFTQINKLAFPNNCEYPAGTIIGYFTIDNNYEFSSLAPIATTITSGSCRKPLFKWTKSEDSSFNESPFRKIYVDPQSEGVYVDSLGKEEGAESCLYYLFEPDCNCDEAVSSYIVFCNPSITDFPKPTLTDCGKRVHIFIPATCETNYDQTYTLSINGNQKANFTLNNSYDFTWDNSPTPITSIKLQLDCDEQNECTIEHLYPESTIDPDPQMICEGDGSATFKFTESSYPVGISSVVFDGSTSTGSGSPKVFTFSGKTVGEEYSYRVYFSNGCVSDEKTAILEDCCNAPEIECLDNGNYQIVADNLSGITYNGSPVGSGIIVPPTSGSLPLVYNCNGESVTIPVYPFNENTECCNIIPTIDVEGSTVTVSLDADSTPGVYTITIGILNSTISPGGTVVINNVSPSATEVLITSNTTDSCYYSEPITATVCDLELQLLMDDENCRLIAQAADKVCACPSGSISGGISSVVQTINNQLTITYQITPDIVDSTGVDVVSSELKLYSNNTLKQTIALLDLNAYNGSFAADEICNSNQTNIPYTITVQPCTTCGSNPYLAIVNIPAPYSLVSATYNSYTETNIGQSGTIFEFYFNVSTNNVSFLLSFSDGVNPSVTSNVFFNNLPTGGNKQGFISIANLSCTDCTDLRFEYTASLEDGCAYSGVLQSTVCIGDSASLGPVSLIKTDATRKMEFVLYEDGIQIRRDFAEDPATVYYEPIPTGYEPGSTYKVVGICSCEEEVETSECFDTVISLPESGNQGSNCSRHYEVLLESCYLGASGNISIGPGGESTSFTINPVSGQALVVFDLSSPLDSDNVEIDIEYDGGYCPKSETFENVGQPQFSIQYFCTAPPALDYDVIITAQIGGSPVDVIVLSSASGTVTGSDNEITGVSVDTPVGVTVQVDGITGCNYNFNIQKGCDCNVLTGVVNQESVNICVINGNIQGSPVASVTVTRTEDADVEATGVLTLTGDPLNTETVTIGAKTYTFQTVLTDVDGNVLIGATAADSIVNLVAAITLGAGAGTLYATSTTAHPTVTAADGTGDTIDITALTAGSAGNAIATTETLTNGSFADVTLTGGIDAAWYAVSGAETLVNGSLSTGAVNFNISTTMAPSVGANVVTVAFRDLLAGDNCITDEFTVNRTDLNYDVFTNPCSGGYWSVTIDNLTSGSIISGASAGTISGNNILNIPVNVGSITFNITKGACISNESATIPEGCSTCSNDNVDITSAVVQTQPCDSNNTNGELRVYAVSTNTNGCNIIDTVVLNGTQNGTFGGGYWTIVIPDTYSGNYTVRATDVCGCYTEEVVSIAQNCCITTTTLSSNVSSICRDDFPETIVYTVNNLPSGYTVSWSGSGAGVTFPGGTGTYTWTSGPSASGGTLRVDSASAGATQVRVVINVYNGAVLCQTITKNVSLVVCTPDLCEDVTCEECQYCNPVNGTCVMAANGTDCDYPGGGAADGECCGGLCIPEGDYGDCGSCGTACPPDPNECSYYQCISGECVLKYRNTNHSCDDPTACTSVNCSAGTQTVYYCNGSGGCVGHSVSCYGETCDPGESCCSGSCQPTCVAPADSPDIGSCTYSHYTCPGSGCGSPSLSHPSCVVSIGSLNFNTFGCIGETCTGTATLNFTKAAACTFQNYVGQVGIYKDGCSGTLLNITCTNQSNVGNNYTLTFLWDAGISSYCGLSLSNPKIYLTFNNTSCCVSLPSLTVSLCPTCATCEGGGS